MSENTREITLEEAKKLYNSSDEAKAFLLSKFTKDELEGKLVPTQEEFNKFFEENVFPLIDYSKTKFLDSCGRNSKIPTSKIKLCNSADDWLFGYDYDQKNIRFFYSYTRVYNILHKKFYLCVGDINNLMISIVENIFNVYGVKPSKNWCVLY
jgi:hypothetical protein